MGGDSFKRGLVLCGCTLCWVFSDLDVVTITELLLVDSNTIKATRSEDETQELLRAREVCVWAAEMKRREQSQEMTK